MNRFSRHALTAIVAACLAVCAAATVGAAPVVQTPGAACTQPDYGAFWEQSSICPSGTNTWQRPAYQFGASTSQTCNAGLAGMLQWTGTAASPNNTFEYCNGTSWMAVNGSTALAAITFTNQTNVNPGSTISSNAVTLSGFSGTLTATCGTGCTAIARNGAWGSTTVANFAAGDTIAIRQTSSASPGTATNATVTVGSITSAAWTVTTLDNGPAAFSFTDLSTAPTAQTVSSNAVTLTGTGIWTANCGSGCTSIAINSVWGGATVTGVVSGNTIAIRQITSGTVGTATTASVTVGSTTSGSWLVTTATACQAGITAGQACPDGTIYAGVSPDGNVAMYTTKCDAGQYWNGSACTVCASGLWSGSGSTCDTTYSSRTDGLVTWNNGGTNYPVTGYNSQTAGRGNTAGLAVLVDTDSPYKAASYCENLTAYGHSDWYLPARNELSVMYTNKTAIGNFDVTHGGTAVSGGYPGLYWSSSENTNNNAWNQRFSDGNQYTYSGKNPFLSVRCARI